MNEITKETGNTVLGCGHAFHLKCVVTWLQREDGAGTCPCCRAEPGELEQIRDVGLDEEEYDDDEGSVISEDVTGHTPLMAAAGSNNCDELAVLFTGNLDLDLEAKDSEGDTALCYAVMNRSVDATEVLLRAGANLLALSNLSPDNDSHVVSLEAALHGAVHYANIHCITALLDMGVDVHCECPGSDGSLPLTTLIRSDEDSDDVVAAARLLMKRGADPHRVDITGWNTFMWFANYQFYDHAVMRVLAPPQHPPGVAVAAAKKIQDIWRHRSCAKILASMKFRAQ